MVLYGVFKEYMDAARKQREEVNNKKKEEARKKEYLARQTIEEIISLRRLALEANEAWRQEIKELQELME